MYGYIYITFNLINSKFYVGQKKSGEYLGNTYLGSGKLIKQAIKKYGVINFKNVFICEAYNQKDLDKKEEFWIDYFRRTYGYNNCYNLQKGGQHYEGKTPSEEVRYKQSIHNKGKIRSDKCRQNMKDRWYITHKNINHKTNTNRRCMYKGNVIKYVKPDEIDSYLKKGFNFGNPKNKDRHGYKHSDETKNKIGKAHKGKTITQEQRNKISRTLKNNYKVQRLSKQ